MVDSARSRRVPRGAACLALTVSILILAPAVAMADTTVSGDVSGVWTKANGPYRIATPCTVPAGQTLTIEPGVDVLFDADVMFTVQGRLLAVGTATDSIRFLASAENDSGTWAGIRITGSDSSTIAWARNDGGHREDLSSFPDFRGERIGGIEIDGARLALRRCVVTGARAEYGAGLTITGGADVTVDSCTVTGNLSDYASVAHIVSAHAVFDGCYLSRNTSWTWFGVWVEGGADVSFRRTLIVYNHMDPGVGAYGTGTIVRLTNCTVSPGIIAENKAVVIMTGTKADGYVQDGSQNNRETLGSIIANWSRIDDGSGKVWPGVGNIAGSASTVDAGPPWLRDADGTRADIGWTGGTGMRIGTPVSGNVAGTWTTAGSPYRVTSAIAVAPGDVLTIEPGVDVLFDVRAPFTVSGKLVATGTADTPIHFAPGDSPTWGGLRFDGNDSSAIARTVVTGVSTSTDDGGISLGGAALDLAGVTIAGNIAARGGGIAVAEELSGIRPRLTARNCAIIANHAADSAGAIYVDRAREVVLAGCRIAGHTSGVSPSAASFRGTRVRIDSCDVRDSHPLIGSGFVGVSFTDCAVALSRTLVAGHDTYYDHPTAKGALVLKDCAGEIVNCTFVDNSTINAKIANANPAAAPIVIVNSIFASVSENWDERYAGYLWAAAPTTVRYSHLAGLDDTTFFQPPVVGVISGNPLLTTDGTYRLQPGSPCIDAGDPAILDLDGSRSDMGWTGGAGETPAPTETLVSGTISTTTWTKAASPYRVTGTITVPVGQMLAIEPGVDVLFDAGTKLTVGGRLIAAGTAQDSIRFLPADSDSVWDGMLLTGSDTTLFAYARIEGMNTVDSLGIVFGTDAVASFRDCVIRSAQGGVLIELADADRVSFTRCLLTAPGRILQQLRGTSYQLTTLELTNCTLYGNDSGYLAILSIERLRVSVRNCILWLPPDKQANGPFYWYERPLTFVFRWSDIASPTVFLGEGNLNVDPLFVDAASGDFRLQPGSPCIDAGSPWIFDANGGPSDIGHTGGGGGEITSNVVLSGAVSGTWTKANSPYGIVGAVTVPEGDTLTIEPGVDVFVDADVSFTVRGRLHAVGTEAEPIRFVAGAAGEWHGLRFIGGDTSTIAHALIADAYTVEHGVPPVMGNGGGIYASGHRLGLSHVAITENTARAGGGMFADSSSVVTFDSCAIMRNHSRGIVIGGGSRAKFTDCHIFDNEGGDVSIGSGSNVAFHRCNISGGMGETSGGIVSSGATVTFDSCTIRGARGNVYTGDFPGIRLTRSIAVLRACTIAENNGIGVSSNHSRLMLADCIIRDNSRQSIGGGGIGLYADTASFVRCLIADNGGSMGRGIAIMGDEVLTLTGCTVAGNRKFALGTGTNSKIAITGSILRGKDGGNAIERFYPRGMPQITATYSDIGNSTLLDSLITLWPGEGNINADPLFADTVSYALASGSPCIDAGDPYLFDPDGSRSDMGWTGGGGEALPRIVAEMPEIALGQASVGTLVIRNNGYADLVLGGLALPDSFSTTFAFPDTIAAGDSLVVPIAFLGEIACFDTAYVVNNDPNRPALAIVLRASAPTAIAPIAHPPAFALAQNVPNPFNPSTAIRFSLAEPGETKLAIYDVSGRHVRTLVSGPLGAGAHEVAWDGVDMAGRRVASGVYLYRLTAADGVRVRRMVLIR